MSYLECLKGVFALTVGFFIGVIPLFLGAIFGPYCLLLLPFSFAAMFWYGENVSDWADKLEDYLKGEESNQ